VISLAFNWFPAIPEGVEPWVYFTCVCGAVIVTGIAKAGFGGGIGILAVPLMIIALPGERAIGVMLPMLIAADIFASLHHMKHRSKPHLKWTLTGMVVGVLLGTVIMLLLQTYTADINTFLYIFIGSLCVIFVGFQLFRMMGGPAPRIPDGAWPGRIAGGFAGVTSMMAHSAGPVMSIYLLERQMEKKLMVGTMVFFFFLMNLFKVPFYIGLGFINPSSLLESLWLVPLVPIGTLLGAWLHHRIPEKPFAVVMYLGAAAAGAHMLYKAFG